MLLQLCKIRAKQEILWNTEIF